MSKSSAICCASFLLCVLCVSVNGQSFLIGSHPDATHYVEERSDIYNLTQTILNTMRVSGGGTLTIANGTYYLSQNVEFYNNTIIKGFGMDDTILILSDFAAKFAKAGFLRTTRTKNILIANITLDGNKHLQIVDGVDNNITDVTHSEQTDYGRYGLFTEGCENVTFDSVRVMNFQGYGFDPHGQKKTDVYGNGLYIRNCVSTSNNWDGFTIDQSFNVYITNCTSRNNGRHGFNIVTGSFNVSIDNSTSYADGYYYPSGTGCGVQVQNNQDYPTRLTTITNMKIIDPKKAGICLNGVSNVTATNNVVYAKTCLRLESSSDSTFTNTICVNTGSTKLITTNLTNVNILNTSYTKDTFNTFSGKNLVIIIGYSNTATLKVREGRDAQPVIQQALDEIKANGVGKLVFEKGVYLLSSYIEASDNTTIVGAGMNDTILRLIDFADPWWIPGTGIKRSGFLRASNVNNFMVANFTLDGNKDNQNTDDYSIYGRYGFFTEACNNVIVDGLKVINFQGYGFDPHGQKLTMTWSVNLTIMNSYSANNGWDGYTIDQSTNVVLNNNVAVNNGRHGFNIVSGSFNLTLSNNRAYGNGYWYYHGNEGCGIMVQNNFNYSTRNVVVMNNYFENSMDAGICVNDVKNIVIQNNTVVRNNTNIPCLKVKNVVNESVSSNACVDYQDNFNNMTVISPFVDPPSVPVMSSSPPFTNRKMKNAAFHIEPCAFWISVMIAMLVFTM